MEKKAGIETKFPDGMTPLHAAALNDQVDLVLLLIEKEADVNAKARNGWTPSDVASKWGHKDVVELLKSHGARS
jgi:ankyrin repeat protein